MVRHLDARREIIPLAHKDIVVKICKDIFFSLAPGAIATWLKAIAVRMDAIAIRVEAMAIRLTAMAIRLEVIVTIGIHVVPTLSSPVSSGESGGYPVRGSF